MARRGSRGGKNRRKNSGAHGGAGSAPGPVNLSNLDAARSSERRGYVVWPTLDAKKEVRPHDRIDIMKKVRSGEENIGLVRRCNEGASALIGNLKPQAATESEEWNREVEEGMRRRYEEPQAFDRAGGLDLYDWQDMIKLSKGRDGDALTVFTEGQDKGSRILFYEAHQIGNGRVDSSRVPDNLLDGVYLDRFGGRAGFQLLTADNGWGARVPRERGIYHLDIRRSGRPRQVSGLAHAVSNFLDMVEILADTKHAVKVAALWGAVLETQMKEDGGATVKNQLKAFQEAAAKQAGGAVPSGDPEADPGPGEVITMESITRGGRFQGLNPGQTLKTLQDTRPHPNQIALLSWLIRDIAWGLGISPEVLWDASNMKGTGMRYVMADTRKFVRKRLRALRRDCRRWWFYGLSKEIKAGRISEPPSGLKKWWASEWIPDADPTIDLGRDGVLEINQVEKKLKTRKEMWGARGKDWREEERQLLIEEKEMAEMRREILGADGLPA